jgi:hypothetical protein
MMAELKYAFGEINRLPIALLDLDPENPRFAGVLGKSPTQSHITDYIADTVGLKDLLSSMSHSGYYLSVPLIGVPEDGRVTIVEGNRRLAAALILLNDKRAGSQIARAKSYPLQKLAKDNLDPLPVLIVKNRTEVLPYLGIAHIVGNKTWDSHAKAAWAVKVLDENLYEGGLRQIAEEIGDTNRTLERMVEAYRLVNQLVESGRFDPSASLRKGRGSAPYPFSWVYTALSFVSVRDYLSLAGDRDPASRNPVPSEKLDEAAELLMWMFGDQRKGEAPRLNDSREIQDLAAAVTNPLQVSHMRRGMSVAESKEEVRPAVQRLTDGLLAAEESLKTVLGVLATVLNTLRQEELESIHNAARRVRDLATHITKTVREAEDRDGASS